MTFEKAIEAMKQWKKVKRKSWDSSIKYAHMNNVRKRVDLISGLSMGFDNNFYNFEDGGLLADDWEIYEEPKKEPEMTAEKASKILDLIPDYINVGELEYIAHCSFSEIAESVRLAIEALENQNQPKPEKKSKCEFNCKIQPAKFIPDDIPTIAFDMFTACLKFGLEIAKGLQEENENNA